MKVIGGIKGIVNNQAALDRHFLIASEMNLIIDGFYSQFDVRSETGTGGMHYQLIGSTNARITDNVQKLKETLVKQDITFENSQTVFNIISKTVLPDHIATEYLNHGEEGQKMYDLFKTERLQGPKSIWDHMKLRKLHTFSSTKKSVKVKLQEKMVTLREERNLMTRFVLASRSRPEIDLPNYLGKHELSVVPRSMFSSAGQLNLGSQNRRFD